MNAAIIDIGSNSIRYMEGCARPLLTCEKKLVTTRLADGILMCGRLSEASMSSSVDAICAFAGEARRAGLRVFAYATSAVRDAVNRDEFLERVYAKCGVRIDVLCGEREALYAMRGAFGDASETGGLIDIGGGSSQLVSHGYAASFPIGCVRAKDCCAGCASLDSMRKSVYTASGALFRFPRLRVPAWRGAGGTITTLAALNIGLESYDRARVGGAKISRGDVEALIVRLWDMGDKRREHPLLRQRHDVIICGALILSYIMDGMGIQSLCATDADGMEGYLLSLGEGTSLTAPPQR